MGLKQWCCKCVASTFVLAFLVTAIVVRNVVYLPDVDVYIHDVPPRIHSNISYKPPKSQMRRQSLVREYCSSNEKPPEEFSPYMLLDESRQLAYCWIPKVGCTNWKRALILSTDMKDDYAVIREFAEKYGDIFYLENGLFGRKPTIVLNSPELIREALIKKQDDFAGRSSTAFIDMATENRKNIVLSDFNETWRYSRKIAHTALRKYTSGHQFQNLMERNAEMISELFRKTASEPVDIFKLTTLVFYNIIATLCFGKDYTLDDPEFNHVKGIIDEANAIAPALFLSDIHPIFKYIPSFSKRRLEQLLNGLFEFVNDKIMEHKKTFDENCIRDFTDYILNREREMTKAELGEFQVELTDVNVRQILLDVFFAGTDSSRLTLTWALMFTASHPDIQRKAQKEIDDNVGREGRITVSSRKRIPYIEAILYETLRLRSSAPLAVPHATTRDTSVGGYNIPKGTTVLLNLKYIHTDPKHFKDPEKFHPDRFLDETGNLAPKPAAFLPFSTGRRQCVGEAFSKLELHIILGMLLQRFSFFPPEGETVDLTAPKSLSPFISMGDRARLVVNER